MKNIVIVGGGYGGMMIVNKLLEGEIPDDVTLTLIDKQPFHGLKTEYYALAAGTVAEYQVRVPFPQDPRLKIKHGHVEAIDLKRHLVHLTDDDPVTYEQLIIALGCTDRHHGVPGAQQYGLSLQSLQQVRHTYATLNSVKPYGTISIVGGGLSGVEIAAELRESRADLNVQIFDRGQHVLSSFPEKLQTYVHNWFTEHDVTVITGSSVQAVGRDYLVNHQQEIATDATVWTAGVQAHPVAQAIDSEKDANGRLIVDEFHRLPGHPEVFVCGDCASLPYAPSAQLAEAQGRQIAEFIWATWWQQPLRFTPIRLRGVLGTLGKKAGFGIMGQRALKGVVPRLLKSGVLWKSKWRMG